ncbi:4Fe-4S binding protein [Methanocaldococcus indicus]|uniref:4Fe-4S binding protein n=1 Tax=Methanocaldococcus indicus TaxID=213231 RepID=UPI003C6D370F
MIDYSRCVRCRVCEQSCPKNAIYFYSYPIKCFHCKNPPCLKACPINAIVKKDETVLILEDRCIGCGLCAFACPFGAIRIEKVAIKCDNCISLDKKVCEDVCPTNAIVSLNNIYKEKEKNINKIIKNIKKWNR